MWIQAPNGWTSTVQAESHFKTHCPDGKGKDNHYKTYLEILGEQDKLSSVQKEALENLRRTIREGKGGGSGAHTAMGGQNGDLLNRLFVEMVVENRCPFAFGDTHETKVYCHVASGGHHKGVGSKTISKHVTRMKLDSIREVTDFISALKQDGIKPCQGMDLRT